MLPDVGHDQAIDALENQGHGPLGYAQAPHHVAHDPDLAAFHDPLLNSSRLVLICSTWNLALLVIAMLR